jgi:hypothetical protein
MNYRQRLHQIDTTRAYLKMVIANNRPYDLCTVEGLEFVFELLDREETWLKLQAQKDVQLVEGGIYSLPLLYEGGMANLNFTTPDGSQILLGKGLEQFLSVVSVPDKVEKQGELSL